MTFGFLKDTNNLNQAVIQLYLSGDLPLHVMRFIESSYDRDPIVRELFELQGAKPLHLVGEDSTSDDSEFEDATIDELLEATNNLLDSTKIVEEIELETLLDQLIGDAVETSISQELYDAILSVDSSTCGIDHLHQYLKAAADGRPASDFIIMPDRDDQFVAAADAGNEESVKSSETKHVWIDQGQLHLNFPSESIPIGLAWVVYLGSDREMSRRLVPLQFAFGTWIGSMALNHLITKSETHERDFYIVPVHVEHLENPGVDQEVRAFVANLPSGAQKSVAEKWLLSVDNSRDAL